MGFVPRCNKAVDDVLFVSPHRSDSTLESIAYRCLHIPSLVISTQLPGGSLSLTENAFTAFLPKCIMESRPTGSHFSAHTKIYSIPACPPTHPRYCFIIRVFPETFQAVTWEVLEVEIDLSIPGPIKIFSGVSRQYTVQCKTSPLYDSDDDLLLYLPLGPRDRLWASPGIRFLRVGKPDKERIARLGGVDNMRLSGVTVDRGGGCVIIWAEEDSPLWTRECSFVWWLDERIPDNMVHSRIMEMISSWSRPLMFWTSTTDLTRGKQP